MNIGSQAAIVLLARRVEATLIQASRAHPDMAPIVRADAERHAVQAERIARQAVVLEAMQAAA